MARGIRLQPIVSQKAAEKIKLVAEENGETVSTIINRLILMQLANPQNGGSNAKVSDLNRLLKEQIRKLAPYNEKLGAGTITFSEKDIWYDIVEQIAKTKIALGVEQRDLDEVMQAHYHREYDELQSEYDYETIRYEAGTMTEEGERTYKEIEQRINVLKDRLK